MILSHREKQSFVTAKLQQKKASSKSFYQKNVENVNKKHG
jgi:hypothetical protein